MKPSNFPPATAILNAVQAVLYDSEVRSATVFYSPDCVAKATRHGKPDKRHRSDTLVLTVGKPNFRGRLFVKACLKAGEPFPVKKVQLRWMNKRKA